MRLRITASVLFVACAAGVCAAQGVPASVTSFGFGGSRSSSPGIPASVTSSGPLAWQFSGNPNTPLCCINPLFPVNPNPPAGGMIFRHHNSFGNGVVPVYVPVYTPYYQPIVVVPAGDQMDNDQSNSDDEDAGPTVFEHRRPRQRSSEAAYDRGYERGRAAEEEARLAREERPTRPVPTSVPERRTAAAPAAEAPTPAPVIEPKTVLVYRDGRKEEIANYAIVGDDLFDFTSTRRKISVASLDVAATIKANYERGIDFQLPAARTGN